jgi:hypothetical protein
LGRYALAAIQFVKLSPDSQQGAPLVVDHYALGTMQSSLPQASADGYRLGF